MLGTIIEQNGDGLLEDSHMPAPIDAGKLTTVLATMDGTHG